MNENKELEKINKKLDTLFGLCLFIIMLGICCVVGISFGFHYLLNP